MRRLVLYVLAAGVCAMPAVAARADDQADIRALYTKFNAAMKSKNTDAVLSMVTPDFKEKKVNGKVLAGKEAEQQMRAQFAMTTRVDDATVKPDSINIQGDKAIVWTSYSMKAEIVDKEGKMGPKGGKHIMADAGKTRDRLIKTPKGWKFYETQTLKQSPTMDGNSTYQMGPRGKR